MLQAHKPFAALLQDPEALATPMVVGLIDAYGTEFFGWEPETLASEVRQDYEVSIPDVNRDKIWALLTATTTNLFYVNLDAFIHICNALSGSKADFNSFDPANVSEMAWAITELSLFDPPVENDPTYQFSPELRQYMTLMLKEEGFTKSPKSLAPYTDLPDNTASIESALSGDGIEFKSYWDSQELKRVEVDQYLVERLNLLAQQLQLVHLRNGDAKAVQDFATRVRKAAAGPQQSLQTAADSVPSRSRL